MVSTAEAATVAAAAAVLAIVAVSMTFSVIVKDDVDRVVVPVPEEETTTIDAI